MISPNNDYLVVLGINSNSGIIWVFSSMSIDNGNCNKFIDTLMLSANLIVESSTAISMVLYIQPTTLTTSLKFASGSLSITDAQISWGWASNMNWSYSSTSTSIVVKGLKIDSPHEDIWTLIVFNKGNIVLSFISRNSGQVTRGTYYLDNFEITSNIRK